MKKLRTINDVVLPVNKVNTRVDEKVYSCKVMSMSKSPTFKKQSQDHKRKRSKKRTRQSEH